MVCGSALPRLPGWSRAGLCRFKKEGDTVDAGDRVGLIRFGSRVDVFLPAGTAPLIIKGQRCVAGETILAQLGVDQDLRAISH